MNKQISALNIHPRSEYDSSMISWFNSLYDIDKNINLKMFTMSFDIISTDKKFPILPIYEAKYQYGNFFIWDILSLELAVNFPNINKIFYFQNSDIPWTKAFNIDYNDWANLFTNPKVNIITHDHNIKEVFDLTWKPIELIQVTPENLYEII